MKIQSDNTSFQSKIKLISQADFQNKVNKLNPKKHYVGYPWNADSIKKGKKLFTNSIMDCIAGGVIDDNNITMFHICTLNQAQAKKNHLKGFDIKNIERRLLEKIDLAKENIHGFILGGFQMKDESKYNINKLNKIKKIFEKYQIPYSIFAARRDVHYFGRFSAFYDNKEDTLYIANNLTNARGINGQGKELEVQDNKIIYHTYSSANTGYKRQKHEGSTEDFLKSQFRQVSLCAADKFI